MVFRKSPQAKAAEPLVCDAGTSFNCFVGRFTSGT
jgi:hypothetical protein